MNAKIKFSLTCLSIAVSLVVINPQSVVGALELVSAYKKPVVADTALYTVTSACNGRITIDKGDCQVLAIKAIANELCQVHNPKQGYSDCMLGASRRIRHVIEYVVIDKLDRTSDSFDLVDIDYKGCSTDWCTDASSMLRGVYLSLR